MGWRFLGALNTTQGDNEKNRHWHSFFLPTSNGWVQRLLWVGQPKAIHSPLEQAVWAVPWQRSRASLRLQNWEPCPGRHPACHKRKARVQQSEKGRNLSCSSLTPKIAGTKHRGFQVLMEPGYPGGTDWS